MYENIRKISKQYKINLSFEEENFLVYPFEKI